MLPQIKKKLVLKTFKLFYGVKIPFKSKRLLVVRLDAIGDYVLFRNCLYHLKESDIFKNYKVYLLGNKLFKNLVLTLDRDVIDHFIWISPGLLKEDKSFKRNFLILLLKLLSFDYVINPVHSGHYYIDRFIDKIGAKKKIGSVGDRINYPTDNLFFKSKRVYDTLIKVPGIDCFEFLRNKFFIQSLTEEKDRALDLNINLDNFTRLPTAKNLKKVVVLFPGAGSEFRRWSTSNFSEVVQLLASKFSDKIKFKITGNLQETPIAQAIISKIDPKIEAEDLTGRTDLTTLLEIIDTADLLISNETGAVHIAAALNKPVICISNGNHFGRFNPYPAEMRKQVKTLYPELSFYDQRNYSDYVEKFKYKSELDINLIDPESVFNAAIEYLL